MGLWDFKSVPNSETPTMEQCAPITMDWERSFGEALSQDMEMVYGPVLERDLSLSKNTSNRISDQIVSEMLPSTEKLISIKQEEPSPPLTAHQCMAIDSKGESTYYQPSTDDFETGQRNMMKEFSLPSILAQSHFSDGMIPLSKEITDVGEEASALSEKGRIYTAMLAEMKNMERTLSSVHEQQNQITDRSKGLSDMLQRVIPELEHKLSQGFYKSSCSELHLWISIHAIAKSCNFDFSDFIKICCPLETNLLLQKLGSIERLIPGLVDVDQESSLPQKIQATRRYSVLVAQQNPSYALSDLAAPYEPEKLSFVHTGILKKGCLKGLESSPHSRLIKASCKRQSHRQKRTSLNCKQLMPKPSSEDLSLNHHSVCPSKVTYLADVKKENCGSTAKGSILEMDLQFLLQKELKPSDVGNLGRIVLPKRQVEKNLPYLESKEGLILAFEDLQTSQIWNLRFRFWPNNKTRMYLLECTGEFIKFHHLEEGDIIVLYKSASTGRYVIHAKKVASLLPLAAKNLKRKEPHAYDCSLELALLPPRFSNYAKIEDEKFALDTCTNAPTKGLCMYESNETEELIQGLSTFEADSRPIDEIIGFNRT